MRNPDSDDPADDQGRDSVSHTQWHATHCLDVVDLAGTEVFGRRIGAALYAGAVVALNGPLGAGKTHLVRAICEGLRVNNTAAVCSPTFTLIHEYAGPVPVYHFDAYRLSGPIEFRELGTDEYLSGDGVCLIEWSDRVDDALPNDHLRIDIQPVGENGRRFQLTATGERSAAVLSVLMEPEV